MKKKQPSQNDQPPPAKAEASSSKLGAWPRPVIAQRKRQSPAIGSIGYSHRHFSGTSVSDTPPATANIQTAPGKESRTHIPVQRVQRGKPQSHAQRREKNASATQRRYHSAASVGRTHTQP